MVWRRPDVRAVMEDRVDRLADLDELSQDKRRILSNAAPGPFERAFANRDLFRGAARSGLFWSLASAVLTLLLVAVAGLILGLCIHHGKLFLELDGPAAKQLEKLAGERLIPPEFKAISELPPFDMTLNPSASPPPLIPIIRDDTGILPTVWNRRNYWYGPALAWCYQSIMTLQSTVPALVTLLLSGAVLTLLRMGCIGQVKLSARKAALEMSAQMRRNIYRANLRLGVEDIEGHTTQRARRIFVQEIESLQNLLFEYIDRTLRLPVEIVVMLAALLLINPLLTIEWLPPLALCWYLLSQGNARAQSARRLAADRGNHELQVMADGLNRSQLIRSYGLEQTEQEAFLNHLDRYTQNMKLKARVQDDALWLRIFVYMAVVAVMVFLLFITLVQLAIDSPLLSLADVLVFLSAAAALMYAARELARVPGIRRQAAEISTHIFQYLDQIPQVSQAVGARFLNPLSKRLQIDQATYKVPNSDQELLDKLDLIIDANHKYALVGIDELDARAVAMAIPRFIELKSGRVLIDGEDVAWATLESLRSEIIFVTSNAAVFPGTILDNIAAGGEFTLQQCTDAAKEAHAHQFIVGLMNGYETVLDPRDHQLSEGQIFQLALARALVRRPALLIIEEPEAALDDDTKALLDDTYDRITSGRTVIFLPQRLATLKRVDEIIVLGQGRVAAQGPHSVLVKESPIYRHWEYLRFNEFRHLSDSGR
ncbi:ATP-binding cassette domain-containing protein [Planctopirus limnophila]|nr:ABC transporter ATP-binding protein [Planctopirus limnophila]